MKKKSVMKFIFNDPRKRAEEVKGGNNPASPVSRKGYNKENRFQGTFMALDGFELKWNFSCAFFS